MLKIKDNVDLKELEKFGYFLNDKNEYYIKHSKNNVVHISINKFTKYIDILTSGGWRDDLDIMYDLIKADLVEKIEE